MQELGKMEKKDTLIFRKTYLVFWGFGKCHKIKAEKHAKLLESQLAESLVALSKSGKKQDSKGFQ